MKRKISEVEHSEVEHSEVEAELTELGSSEVESNANKRICVDNTFYHIIYKVNGQDTHLLLTEGDLKRYTINNFVNYLNIDRNQHDSSEIIQKDNKTNILISTHKTTLFELKKLETIQYAYQLTNLYVEHSLNQLGTNDTNVLNSDYITGCFLNVLKQKSQLQPRLPSNLLIHPSIQNNFLNAKKYITSNDILKKIKSDIIQFLSYIENGDLHQYEFDPSNDNNYYTLTIRIE